MRLMDLDAPTLVRHIGIMTALNRLKQRRQAIAEQIAEFTGKIAALKAEDKELETAEVVVGRFEDEDHFFRATVTVGPPPDSKGKPPGTPTTPNMILTLLREAAAENKPGLEPREMQMIIARRWWPGVKSEDIGPTAWRMWKEARLAKDGPLYMLPGNHDLPKAAGDLLGGEPAASESNAAKGREAGPGGGT
jgi:3',5'-cyclic AMP phosphodiesterase CpdA